LPRVLLGRGWAPTVVYDAPIMFLLGVLGAELPGHLTPPQAPWVPPLLEEEVNRTQLPPLQTEVRVPWRPPHRKGFGLQFASPHVVLVLWKLPLGKGNKWIISKMLRLEALCF